MWNWLVRQYNDIRGNLKWALLLGLWYVIIHYGRQMLQLIPHISQWMVWTIVIIVSLVVFVWVAKANKQMQQPSMQPTNNLAVAPMPTLSGLLGQAPQITFDAGQFFRVAYFSPVTAEIENNIKIVAETSNPGDHEAFYARFIGVGVVAYTYDTLWLIIYKSQLLWLYELNRKGLLPIAEAKKFYDQAVIDFPKAYANYSFDQWMGYLKDNAQLLIKYPSEMLEITHKGKDFLKYLAHRGCDVNVKAN
jgi:hypothetical protein